MLQGYFCYVEYGLCVLEKETTPNSLRSFLEEEWTFSKEICPFITGGMAEAGKRFWYCSFSVPSIASATPFPFIISLSLSTLHHPPHNNPISSSAFMSLLLTLGLLTLFLSFLSLMFAHQSYLHPTINLTVNKCFWKLSFSFFSLCHALFLSSLYVSSSLCVDPVLLLLLSSGKHLSATLSP